MSPSDEVRVVEGTYQAGIFHTGRPLLPHDRPALLVFDSGLTAHQLREAIEAYGVRVRSTLAPEEAP